MGHQDETGGEAGPIGGQALLEGVMMRQGDHWAAAVRRPDGSITTMQRALPHQLARWRSIPLVRGVLALAESTMLGTRATMWAAQARTSVEFSRTGLAVSAAVAAMLALGVFGLLPALLVKAAGITSPLTFNLAEGALRIMVLVGYLALLGRSPQVKRVFGYHGAEHMTIHAFEHRVPLETAAVRAFGRRHARCGTSFLLVVVGITVMVHVLLGTPGWAMIVVSRIVGLPLVAGLAYEVIRFAGRHDGRWYARLVMAPGFWVQTLTTREPDDDMIEVAIAALGATQLAARPDAVAA